jgi:hypothetical protein
MEAAENEEKMVRGSAYFFDNRFMFLFRGFCRQVDLRLPP